MRTGQLLGNRYRLDTKVGGGGMGEVWHSWDDRLNRTVAVKVLHSTLASDPTFRRRFQSEAHAMAQLRARGVVNLYDYGEDRDDEDAIVCYLVMEFVPGRSLADLLDEHERLDHQQVVPIIAQAADALHGAHCAGVIHRDVKPGNILIDQSGKVTLVDFGIAVAHGESGLTATGMIMGTISYVSPEQLRNNDSSPASDMYALGVVAHECLTGERPFTGDSPAVVIAGHLNAPPPPLPPEVPDPVAELVTRALAKEPGDRWADAGLFAQACRAALSPEPSPERAVTPAASLSPDATDPQAWEDDADAEVTPARPAVREAAVARHRHTPSAKHKRHRLLIIAAAAVAAAVALTALTLGGGETAVSSRPQQSSTEPATAHSDSPSISESESPSGESDASPSPSAKPPSDEAAPELSESPPPNEPELVTVPGVVSLLESDAVAELKRAGFDPHTSQLGEGTYACGVETQNPDAAAKAPEGSKVTIGIRYVAEGEPCP